jgi:glycosyltransferase involved in cell wall biosynthesis
VTDVSICIASHRPDGLARLLESIGRLKRPEGVSFEVVVVENAPAQSVVVGAALRSRVLGAPVRALLEPRRNLAHVRNRSVEHAEGRWIAFVDDDEMVHEDWLLAYWRMVTTYAADGYFGPALSVFEPNAKRRSGAQMFKATRFPTGTLLSAAGLRTSNAFLCRALFERFRFDPAYATLGEDWDLFRRMVRSGVRFVWCDEAIVDESVPSERLRLAWLSRRAFMGGVAYARVESGGPASPVRLVAQSGIAALGGGLATPVAALLGRAIGARVWLRTCVQVGKLYGAFTRPKPGWGS